MKMDAGFELYTRNPSSGPEDGEHQGLGRLSVVQEVERQEGGGDRGDAGRQPVHVVEQVDGVGDADQPEEGDRHVDRRRSGPGQGQPAPDDHRRPHDLTAQLLVGLEVEEVVDEPDQEQEGAGAEHHPGLRRERHEGEVDRGNHGEDRPAAQQGRRLLVPAVALGTRHNPPAPRQGTHHRGQHERAGEREDDWQEINGVHCKDFGVRILDFRFHPPHPPGPPFARVGKGSGAASGDRTRPGRRLSGPGPAWQMRNGRWHKALGSSACLPCVMFHLPCCHQ